MRFDPRVQPKNGDVNSMRQVWDAESVQIAYDAYNDGIPLIATPFITGQPHLRRPGLLYEWSDYEIKEAAKCKADILYFADTYCQLYRPDGTYGPVKLRKYQRKYLKLLQQNRFVVYVASRQIGKTVCSSIFLTWKLLFTPFNKWAVLGDKFATAAENIDKIKNIIIRLPFFLRPGITVWNQRAIAFDNGSSCISGPCNLSTLVGRSLSGVYCDEFAIPEDNVTREVFEFVLPTIVTQKDANFIMTSSPRGAHGIFYETYTKAKMHKGPFVSFETHWNEVPGRDEAWHQQQLDILGEKGFAQQYDCQFLADDDAWLSPETMDCLNKLMLDANYLPGMTLTDNERALRNLAKIEKVILASKYVTKATVKPKRSLLSLLQFDENYVHSLSDLKHMPLILPIDTGEGKKSDYTIVGFYLPEVDDGKDNLLAEAYKSEIAEIEANANEDSDAYEDEDAAIDAMVDMDEVDENGLTTDYLLVQGVRCRQIGVLATNEHSIPMVALFVQIFLYYFADMDKVKLLCELDGIGSKMQALLATDIINNSGIDLDVFGTNDHKGSPGIYMRGRNKAGYVYDTQQLLEDNRILVSYGANVFELSRFREIKPGKFAGVDAHDDFAMDVVLLGAYMASDNFKEWMDDILSPVNEQNEDDYED